MHSIYIDKPVLTDQQKINIPQCFEDIESCLKDLAKMIIDRYGW